MAVNNEDYINQIYDQAQKKQNAALEQSYNESISGLDASKVANQKATDANLTRTYTEANKAQQGFNEVQNAQGLSSGAMAQSQLARDTQLQQDLTTLRAAQASADADIERQRNLLGQQYASQLQQAAASNDLERIKMIYQAAKDEEDKLNAQKVEAGKAIYSYNQNIIPYLQALGMTDEEIKALGISQPSSGGGGGTTGASGTNDYYSAISKVVSSDSAKYDKGTALKNIVAATGTLTPEQKTAYTKALIAVNKGL